MGTYLLTGGTRGVGRAAAEALALRGHRLLLVARSPDLASEVAAEMPDAEVIRCDLSDPEAVDAVTVDEPLDGIVSVAGVLNLRRVPAAGGVDQTWAANFLGPARLTRRLMARLVPGGRVSFVSGQAHKRFPLSAGSVGGSAGLRAAAEVTTAKILWIRALARKHPEICATTFCPGRIRTDLNRALPWYVRPLVGVILATGAPPATAAPGIVSLAEGDHPSGTFLISGEVATPASHTADPALQDAAWDYAGRWAVS